MTSRTCLTCGAPTRSTRPLTSRDLLELPATVDPETACRVLNISRSKGYDLIRADAFPCRVLRLGSTYRIPSADLLALVGVTAPASVDDVSV